MFYYKLISPSEIFMGSDFDGKREASANLFYDALRWNRLKYQVDRMLLLLINVSPEAEIIVPEIINIELVNK